MSADRGVVDTAALKAWADSALREAHSRPSWREGLSVGEAAGLAGGVLALLEHIRQLEKQLLGAARGGHVEVGEMSEVECDGGPYCGASRHIHGCFSEVRGASTTETAKPSNQELAALQKWAQQVHDALDGRPLPPCPDEAAARVEALLAERDALQGDNAELTRQRDELRTPWLMKAMTYMTHLAGA